MHVGQPSEDDLELYLLGHLAPSGVTEIAAHVALCEDCRIRLQELREFIEALREAGRDLEE